MWKFLVLVLLLHSCNSQVIDIARCCKDNEDVTLSKPDNHVQCRPMSDNFPLPVILNNGDSIYSFPNAWNIRDNALPVCPTFFELKFIPFTYQNDRFRLYETGDLILLANVSAINTIKPKHYCLAANGFLACSYNPYMTTNKVLRKCCGENYYLKMPNCIKNEDRHLWVSMKEDLENLLGIDSDYFITNNITVKKGYPYCPHFDRTYNVATRFKVQLNADIVLDHHHVIPAGEFCIEHDRTYSKDKITVVTCSKYAYSSGLAFRSNVCISISCALWIWYFRRPLSIY